MLYDPKWEKKGITKDNFVAWLGEQPPTETYPYRQSFGCAVSQFFESRGVIRGSCSDLEQEMGIYEIVANRPYTFGAAYQRATVSGWRLRWLKFRSIFTPLI